MILPLSEARECYLNSLRKVVPEELNKVMVKIDMINVPKER